MKRIVILVLIPILLALLPVAGLAEEPKVTLIYGDTAQFELISPQGVRVLFDVYMPFSLSKPAAKNDILLTTHSHSDHIFPGFESKFPGQKITCKEGTLTKDDVTITSFFAAHNDLDGDYPANYVFVVDAGGFRVAHFGDIGIPAFTPEQLAQLHDIDIAIMQFDNFISNMYSTNLKGFNLMEQVQPRLIIPTHMSLDCARIASERWDTVFAKGMTLRLGRSAFGEKTKYVIMGENAKFVKAAFEFPTVDFSK